MKKLLTLLTCISLLNFGGCITTLKTQDRITGNYRNEDGSLGKPNPYYFAVLPFAIVFDIATSPIQALWLGAQL